MIEKDTDRKKDMLKIRIESAKNRKVYGDSEKEFSMIEMMDTPTVRKLIELIDEGEYLDENSFIDRFGFKQPRDYLSTGCKTAIVIEINGLLGNDVVIDTIECGINAIDAIIHYCKNGSIIMTEPGITISFDDTNRNCDIELGGYRFTDIARLNHYIFKENTKNPDMSLKGIEKM